MTPKQELIREPDFLWAVICILAGLCRIYVAVAGWTSGESSDAGAVVHRSGPALDPLLPSDCRSRSAPPERGA